MEFDNALRLDPEFVLALQNRGESYFMLGEYERAIQDYDEVIEIKPEFVLAHVTRGRAYYALGEYEPAIKNYNEALRLDPEFAMAYYSFGVPGAICQVLFIVLGFRLVGFLIGDGLFFKVEVFAERFGRFGGGVVRNFPGARRF